MRATTRPRPSRLPCLAESRISTILSGRPPGLRSLPLAWAPARTPYPSPRRGEAVGRHDADFAESQLLELRLDRAAVADDQHGARGRGDDGGHGALDGLRGRRA